MNYEDLHAMNLPQREKYTYGSILANKENNKQGMQYKN